MCFNIIWIGIVLSYFFSIDAGYSDYTSIVAVAYL